MESRFNMNEFMNEANNEALENKKEGFINGGPFGAIIVKDNKIISKAHNTVLKDNDPTAHAEINAIRKACQILNTNNLEGCVIYTTCYPCPMCLSAIIWANIKIIYYGNTKEDAASIGFKDDDIYKLINNPKEKLNIINIDRDETIKVFNDFKNNPHLY